jgi:SAM-dependent methyltransferase
MDLTQLPQTDPLPIFRQRDGIYTADLLGAAVAHLDFFTWLDKTPADLAGVCRAFSFHERPVDVMLTLFCAMGLLEKRNGMFCVTPMAREHLVAGSPWNLAPYFGSLKERPVCRDFITILRTDKPANWGSYKDEQEWAKAMEGEEFARSFTAAMDCRGVYLGQKLAQAVNLSGNQRLLDIGGGSGIYACALAARHAHLRAAVMERAPVDTIARAKIAGRGLADRVEVLTGDFFQQPLPTGFDVHLYSNVLHDWDVPAVRMLLAKSHATLPPGGRLLIHDMHLNVDKTGPLPVASYSAILMAVTEGRCYSVAEMEAWLVEAGFADVFFAQTAADRSVIMARKTG